MEPLTPEQERDIAVLTDALFDVYYSARKASFLRKRAVTKRLTKKHLKEVAEIWFRPTLALVPDMDNRPTTQLGLCVRDFFAQLEPKRPDRYGAMNHSREEIITGLRTTLQNYYLADALARVLTTCVAPTLSTPPLRFYVDAGIALEQFARLDPNFNVVRPGIASFRTRLNESPRLRLASYQVVDSIQHTLERAFATT